MAVVDYNGNESYTGCVLETYEKNGYEDSDWFAVVWDGKSNAVKEVRYDTTRYGGGGSAVVDITEENLRKAYRYYKRQTTDHFDGFYNVLQAKRIHKGDTVVAIKGRILPKGETAKVFWVGQRYNSYKGECEKRVGIEYKGERKFLPAENVEVVDWEDRMITGKARKKIIREMAIAKLPVCCIEDLRR